MEEERLSNWQAFLRGDIDSLIWEVAQELDGPTMAGPQRLARKLLEAHGALYYARRDAKLCEARLKRITRKHEFYRREYLLRGDKGLITRAEWESLPEGWKKVIDGEEFLRLGGSDGDVLIAVAVVEPGELGPDLASC